MPSRLSPSVLVGAFVVAHEQAVECPMLTGLPLSERLARAIAIRDAFVKLATVGEQEQAGIRQFNIRIAFGYLTRANDGGLPATLVAAACGRVESGLRYPV